MTTHHLQRKTPKDKSRTRGRWGERFAAKCKAIAKKRAGKPRRTRRLKHQLHSEQGIARRKRELARKYKSAGGYYWQRASNAHTPEAWYIKAPYYRRFRTRFQYQRIFKKILYRSWRFGVVAGLPDWIYAEAAARREAGHAKPLRKPSFWVKSIGHPPPPRRHHGKPVEYVECRCPACTRSYWTTRFAYDAQMVHFCSDACRQAMAVYAHLLIFRPTPSTQFRTIETRTRLYALFHPREEEDLGKALASFVIRDIADVMRAPRIIDSSLHLTNAQHIQIRRRIADVVDQSFDLALANLQPNSTTSWSPAQVKLFLALLDKIVANAVPPSTSPPPDPAVLAQDITKLSRADLERLAAQANPTDLDISVDDLNDPQP